MEPKFWVLISQEQQGQQQRFKSRYCGFHNERFCFVLLTLLSYKTFGLTTDGSSLWVVLVSNSWEVCSCFHWFIDLSIAPSFLWLWLFLVTLKQSHCCFRHMASTNDYAICRRDFSDLSPLPGGPSGCLTHHRILPVWKQESYKMQSIRFSCFAKNRIITKQNKNIDNPKLFNDW